MYHRPNVSRVVINCLVSVAILGAVVWFAGGVLHTIAADAPVYIGAR
jgi:hypothetical protein